MVARRRTPATVVWAALAALGLGVFGMLLVIVGLGWHLLHLSGLDDGRSTKPYVALSILLVVLAVALVLTLVAGVLLVRGSGAGRGLGWVAAAFSAPPLLSMAALAIDQLTHLIDTDPPAVVYLLDAVGGVLGPLAMAAAVVLLALPGVRSHVLAGPPGWPGNERPRALATARKAAIAGVAGSLLVVLAYALALLVMLREAEPVGTSDVATWGALIVSAFLVTALAAVVLVGVALTSGRRLWARRSTLVLAMMLLFSSVILATSPVLVPTGGTDHPALLAAAVSAAAGGLMTVICAGTVIVLLSTSAVVGWVASKESAPPGWSGPH